MEDKDIIVGIHSIVHAIRNPMREIFEVVATDEGIENLTKMGGMSREEVSRIPIRMVSSHLLQELGKEYYDRLGFQFNRIPSGVYLVTNPVELLDPNWIFDQIKSGRFLKILCLDGVTDVQNASAIMRTAAFYDVDCIVVATKNNFGLGPSVARIASGALEYVKIVKCSSLPKFIQGLEKRDIFPIGLSEHAEEDHLPVIQGTRCLILGAEDKGLSNATLRLIKNKIKLTPQGKIQSLNVSVAAAIAMERVFK